MRPEQKWVHVSLWPSVAVLTVIGLALRVAAARGGLWTDEAWSMIYAQKAGDPLGVFLRINHDNNHHLISLWMQAVGVHASPLLTRVPAIAAGTAAIPVAAWLLAPRSTSAAIASAAMFAISPIMVTYGSEARGYALMILAALLVIGLATRAIHGTANRPTAWVIGVAAVFGMLSNLTMLAPVALVTLWVYLERRRAAGAAAAIPATIAPMGPALLGCGAVIALVFGAAWASPTGLQVGGYQPFTLNDYLTALSELVSWTFGLAAWRWLAVLLLFAIGAAMAIRPPGWLGNRGRLYGILILGVPVAIGLERTGNALFARYYLCSAIGLVLLASEWVGRSLSRPGVARALSVTACALFLVASGWKDARLIALERGEPDRPLHIIARQSPGGASLALGTARLYAPMMAAAERLDYPLTEAKGCAPAPYMIAIRGPSTTPKLVYCGRPMTAIAWSETTELTGDAWVLYRQGLQTSGPPVSGLAPRRAESPQPRRAGVAQG